MTEQELSDFVISQSYPLTDEDKALIHKASPGTPIKEHWYNSCLSALKQRLREYYTDVQNDKCAYCRMDISRATGLPHIEHIAPKSLYPQWMYKPVNLCLACPRCNSFKGAKDVLINKNAEILPVDSSSYTIVHPHLDRYSDHIHIIDDLLYQGVTEKGINTIQLCHLMRTGLLEERAKIKIRQEQCSDSYTKLLMIYYSNPDLIENWDELIMSVAKLIHRYQGDS